MATLYAYVLRAKSEKTYTGLMAAADIVTSALLVNPTDITVKKHAQIAQMRTMAGTAFQPWPNVPDVVSFKGIMYGMRAVQDFNTLQRTIDKRPDLKEVDLIYKFKSYSGYVEEMTVSAVAGKPRQFEYSFTFISKTPFDLPRMMAGQLDSYQAELDYFRSELNGWRNSISTDPLTAGINGAFAIAMMTNMNISGT